MLIKVAITGAGLFDPLTLIDNAGPSTPGAPKISI